MWRGALVTVSVAAALAAGCNQDDPAKASPAKAPGAARPAATLEWANAEVPAFARAHREHRGVVLFETAAWAAPSKEMERTLSMPEVQRGLGNWIAVKVDVSDGTEADAAWQARHHAETLPYLGFYDADGHELARIETYVEVDELLRRVPALPAAK
jgi:thiol:disulfide interchange protein